MPAGRSRGSEARRPEPPRAAVAAAGCAPSWAAESAVADEEGMRVPVVSWSSRTARGCPWPRGREQNTVGPLSASTCAPRPSGDRTDRRCGGWSLLHSPPQRRVMTGAHVPRHSVEAWPNRWTWATCARPRPLEPSHPDSAHRSDPTTRRAQRCRRPNDPRRRLSGAGWDAASLLVEPGGARNESRPGLGSGAEPRGTRRVPSRAREPAQRPPDTRRRRAARAARPAHRRGAVRERPARAAARLGPVSVAALRAGSDESNQMAGSRHSV